MQNENEVEWEEGFSTGANSEITEDFEPDEVDEESEDIEEPKVEYLDSPLDRYLALRRRYLELGKERKEIKIEMAREESMAVEMFHARGINKIELTDTVVRLVEKVKEVLKVEQSLPKAEEMEEDGVLPGQKPLSSMRDIQAYKAGQALENTDACTVDDLMAAEEEQAPEESEQVVVPDEILNDSTLNDDVLRSLSDGLI